MSPHGPRNGAPIPLRSRSVLLRPSAPLLALALFGCAPQPSGASSAEGPAKPVTTRDRDEWIDKSPPPASPPPVAVDQPSGHDFAEEARLLFRIAACGNDAELPAHIDARTVRAHCDQLTPKLAAYRARYVTPAKAFLAPLHPPGLPRVVVYPFAGGDLVTALTTYPDATEITTLSLELAGDPRRLRGIDAPALDLSLRRLRAQLDELIGYDDYSKSETLKKTQRGEIPGELGFFLVGLAVHGYEPVSLRYFTLRPDGAVHYLTLREIEEVEDQIAQKRKRTWIPPDFSEAFANVEIVFERPGAKGEARRVHRHIAANLSDDHIRDGPGLVQHLERKGSVAAMTKAASYLLWNDGFSLIRRYLLANMVFMVSDSTGVPPALAKDAGFVQETYGSFRSSLLRASHPHNVAFRKLWEAQPQRKLPFRYGYKDSAGRDHLVITKRPLP
jgi:hypothetical protein